MPSRPRIRLVLLLLSATSPLGDTLASTEEERVVTLISPGSPPPGALIAEPCPTFSWGATEGAERYALALFDAQWSESPSYETQALSGAPIYQVDIDAPALSWTPAGERCLEDGGRYLWFVRTEGSDDVGPWSAGQVFEVDLAASALSEVVRREVTAQLSTPETWSTLVRKALASHRQLTLALPATASSTAMREGADATAASAFLAPESTTGGEGVAATFNSTALRVSSASGVVFDDAAGGGAIPAEGSGRRFMWYPGKGALRAGRATADEWNDSNTGVYSVALGLGTTARGGYSTALGRETTASGSGSTALGWYAVASDSASTAMGYDTHATGAIATALGSSTTASGSASTAMGQETTASLSYATAMGWQTTASGRGSTSMGYRTQAESAYEVVIGYYDTNYVPTGVDFWSPGDRLFVIGNGASESGRHDALLVHKNGNLTIAGNAYKPGGGTWMASSDARLKTVSGSYEPGLESISQLKAVRFHYLPDNPRGHDSAPEHVGFVAQQVQAVLPEAVQEGADGYLDLDMHVIHVAMVNAIREQQAQIDDQRAELAALRAELDALRHRLAAAPGGEPLALTP